MVRPEKFDFVLFQHNGGVLMDIPGRVHDDEITLGIARCVYHQPRASDYLQQVPPRRGCTDEIEFVGIPINLKRRFHLWREALKPDSRRRSDLGLPDIRVDKTYLQSFGDSKIS